MIRILVIDDEANIRLLLKEIFTMIGAEVIEAENGKTGLEQLQKEKMDLVFLDKRMPVMSGEETLKAIRSISDVPVYVVSAFQTAEETEVLVNLGVTGILTKPFTIAQVSDIVKKYK